MIGEREFEKWLDNNGYYEVDIEDSIATEDGLEVIRDYLDEFDELGEIPLRETYNAIMKIMELQKRCVQKNPEK